MTPRSVVWVIDGWYCQVFRERKEEQVQQKMMSLSQVKEEVSFRQPGRGEHEVEWVTGEAQGQV